MQNLGIRIYAIDSFYMSHMDTRLSQTMYRIFIYIWSPLRVRHQSLNFFGMLVIFNNTTKIFFLITRWRRAIIRSRLDVDFRDTLYVLTEKQRQNRVVY